MEAEIMNEIITQKPVFEMDIQVNIPENMPPVEHNLNQLKDYAQQLKTFYGNLVIKESDIKDAESECTKLNKLKDQVKRLRIDNVNKYKKPIEDFETMAKQIESLLDDAKGTIKVTLDKYEEKRMQDKLDKIINPIINQVTANAFYQGYIVKPEQIVSDKRWFNKTIKDTEIEADIQNQVNTIIEDQKALNEGIKVICNTIDMLNTNLNKDMYVERFKYNRDLASILDNIKVDNDRLKTEEFKQMESVSVNNVSHETSEIITCTFRGTKEQMAQLKVRAIQLGMEEL